MNLDQFITIVKPLSETSIDRIKQLYIELENIRLNNIEGDFVECGVFKGGNILGMMQYCKYYNLSKTIWLYDTFNGMTQPEDIDIDHQNIKANDQFNQVICRATLQEVKANLSMCDYSNIKYIIGDVCQTLLSVNNIPNQISLLRLDTDWYASTKCELEILFPKLTINGSLIIDDYGHWQGCKKAVDEYFYSNNIINYNNIDYTGILIKKT